MSVAIAVHPSVGLRILVVDDDRAARQHLAGLLRDDPRVAAVRTAPGAAAALRVLADEPQDALFCDVRLRGLDGVALARVVGRFAESPQVVFVTADTGHAVEAFEVAAADYLLKPVCSERLQEAVGRLRSRRVGVGDDRTGVAAGARADETIAVELAGVISFVHRSEVRFVAADGDYVRLHTARASHLLRTTLAELERRWADSGFLRVHRHTLVSLAHVDHVRHADGRHELMLGTDRLPVSRRHVGELMERLRGL
jgi:DNA-binding LytR/AlgR family response regulator